MKRSTTPIRLAIAAFTSILCLTYAPAAITVTTERRASGLSTSGTFIFNTIPSNTSTDAANGLTFAVLAGSPHAATGPISNLTNGLAQTSQDSVSQSFFSVDDASTAMRIQVDLEAPINIGQINTYSWHIYTRAPQIFKVYGALAPSNNAPNYSAAGFMDDNALSAHGYNLIATVNTVPLDIGNQQHGVSISGNIGTYRYLLFDVGVPLTGPSAAPRASFFGEIDVIEAPPVEPGPLKLTITPATLPATGYDLEWASQAGKLYNLRTRTDLDAPIATWDLVAGNIEATPPSNLYNVQTVGPRRFYAIEEFDAPPP